MAAAMFQTCVAGQIATLTMSSPPVNALSEAWLSGLAREIAALEARQDWKVLHLRSGQKVFCAGADLKEMRARFDAADGPDRTYAYVASIQRLYARIEALPQVTLAEIGGAALGGGFELALACDLRIAAVEAKLGLPEVNLGLIPGGGGTQRLTRLVGRGLAGRLILGAEAVDGATAERLGLVQWACPRAELAARAEAIAARIAALPAAALAAAKRCVASAATPGRGGYGDEIEFTRDLQTNAETRERISAFIAGARA
ncbi:enoyl-CoA hydratase/isomerase family protein [Bradyrhizobium sp.]|uniref:enoyl-CoA hydratase/isomerase family protein n=1 Tax=Bradyrhizobium sp. TaxID=376 RepID=UPI001D1D1763|nr:enoyl-CoA hydratase/isomerase family protein [Bradyrhizobium sp.]MBI5321224.1 enoyl-CoA hydratase/isomerase family protein [Bradyrhizobium sp.]